jgi:pimeloyl-ACP methyl ester carboxylesterase
VTPPETRYAKGGDVHIAYQVVGDGSLDLIFVPGFVSNVEMAWETPGQSRFHSRLAAFSRLILFDKRGTGLSDRDVGVAHLEERMDDVRAVMDAVGSKRAALFGISEGGAMSMLFSATHPERTQALILYGSYARHPTLTPESLPHHAELIGRVWGSGEYLMEYMMPARASDENLRRAVARYERQSASPTAAIACIRMSSEVDARDILPTIRVPTLVLHRTGDERVTIDAGRYIADRIPAPSSSNCRASITSHSTNPTWSIASLTRSRSSSPGHAPQLRQIGCWRLSCSPTLSTRRNRPPRLATDSGAPCSTDIMRRCASRSPAFAVTR